MEKNIVWFKNEFIPLITKKYEIEFRLFKDGDFGDLERIEFEGNNKSGYVDFWSLGWLNIHFIDTQKKIDLLNILLQPEQVEEKDKVFED